MGQQKIKLVIIYPGLPVGSLVFGNGVVFINMWMAEKIAKIS
jgi:hypothetical protein